MKLNLWTLGQTTEELQAQLPELFDAWEREINAAEPIFNIQGERLEGLARDIPQHQAKYARLAQEAKAAMKWLEILRTQKEAKYVKNYNNSPRALGAREQTLYVQGEREIVELNQLLTEINYKQQQFEEIVDAIKQLGWMIGHITKLRVAELYDVII